MPQNPDGLSLLALLTDHVYEQEQNGTLRIPVGYGSSYGPYQDRQANVLAEYDPLQIMMRADTQNRNAAWQVMGGQYGGALAQMLLNPVNGDLPGIDGRFVQGPMNDEGRFAGYFTLYPPGRPIPGELQDGDVLFSNLNQNVVGSFLDASTSAPRGTSSAAWYSAEAAKNIILNTASPIGDNGITEDPAVEKALLDTAQRYMIDLADSTTYRGPGSHVIHYGGGTTGPYVLKIFGDSDGTTPLSSFLQQIMSNSAEPRRG